VRNFLRRKQGDQNGGIFASWESVVLGKFLAKLQKNPKVWGNFLHGKSYALILTKFGFCYILGNFWHKRIWSPWT
jgi:hypothetical protein